MSEKKNFWNQVISAMNGSITFGKLSPKGDVTSSVAIEARDGRHFMCFDEDGPRTGYTLMSAPGSTFIDIELVANCNSPQAVIWANAYETLKLDSKNVTIDGKQSCKIMTSGLMTIRGSLGMQMLSPLIEGVSRALTKDKLPEPAQIDKE